MTSKPVQVSELELQYNDLLWKALEIRRSLECDLGNIEAALQMMTDHYNLCAWSELEKQLSGVDYQRIDNLAAVLKDQLKTLEGLSKALDHIGPSKNFRENVPANYLPKKEGKNND